MIHAIERGYSKASQIKSALMGEIRMRLLASGDNLPFSEKKLAQLFNVSRQTIRAALAGLEKHGVVEISGRGRKAETIVSRADLLTHDENVAFEMLQAEKHIRMAIIAHVVKLAQPADIASLREKLKEQEQALALYNQKANTMSAATAFQRYTASTVGFNTRIRQIDKTLLGEDIVLMDELIARNTISIWNAAWLTRPQIREETFKQSQSLLTAFEKKDPVEAMKSVGNLFDLVIHAVQEPDVKPYWVKPPPTL